MTQITKGSDLLPKKAVEALEPKQLTTYQANAAKFVEEFNAAYPDGKAVRVPISNISIGNDGRINFVVGKVDDLSTQSIGLPFEVVDRIAENLGCGSAEGLLAVSHSTVEPLLLQMTVKAVNAGDTYATKEGTKSYKVPALVKIDGSREEIVLSDDAADIVAEMQKIVLKDAIMNAGRNRRKPVKGAKAATTVTADDEADV